tara:strand:- start:311 stop:538 length:228 start_codon:yes stop_codon:yes gene_type:complete
LRLHILKEKMTLTVNVKDNNIEQALRSMKKKLQREGLFKEMKLRKHYEKPSLKRAREKEENIRRSRKNARQRNND